MSKLAQRLRQQGLQVNHGAQEITDKKEPSVTTSQEEFEYQTIKNPDTGKEYEDPRPDMPEDSFLWLQMFVDADRISPEFYQHLLYMRSAGTRIVTGKSGGFVIRPEIGGKGTWLNEAQYKEYAARWLAPHRNEIIKILANLFQWSQVSSPAS